jgi:hypothetical protein
VEKLVGESLRTDESSCSSPENTEATPCEQSCQNRICGDDGCGGVCGLCPNAYDCEDGWCEPRIPTADSPQSLYQCFIDCGPSQECALGCTEEYPPEVYELMTQLLNCTYSSCLYCASPTAPPMCFLSCMIEECTESYEPLFSGEYGCGTTSMCMELCRSSSSAVCWQECLVMGTLASQIQWHAILNCIQNECSSMSDTTCTQGATKGNCEYLLEECFSEFTVSFP